MKSGFLDAPSLQSPSLPQAAEALQWSSAPSPSSCIRMRRWEEGFLIPWGMLHDMRSYLDCCTKRRAKSHPELPTLLSSPPCYSEEKRTAGPLLALWSETHEAEKARLPRHLREHAHSPHTETEQPQLQRHPTPLQPHLPVEGKIQVYILKHNTHIVKAHIFHLHPQIDVNSCKWCENM